MNLAHHFFQLPIGGLSAAQGCREALEHLNSRYEIAEFLVATLEAAGNHLRANGRTGNGSVNAPDTLFDFPTGPTSVAALVGLI